MKTALALILLAFIAPVGLAQGAWRVMTDKELRAAVPDRAQVEKESIETELRTASGVVSADGKHVYGVVLITAGYAAEGKYSHYFVTRAPLVLGELTIQPGAYVFGYQRADADSLEVRFYEAATGSLIGATKARRGAKTGPIRSFAIDPLSGTTYTVQIGRFAFEFGTK